MSYPLLHWAVASRALRGELVSGDGHLVHDSAGGVLVAVVDGLGHGPDAVVAATRALDTVAAYAREPLVPLLQHCHEQLQGTRGVVMSVACFRRDRAVMSWIGVGDVEAVLVRGGSHHKPVRESLPLRGGVIGYQLPPLRESTLPVTAGDPLILATDGIRPDFVEDAELANPLLRRTLDGPQQIADAIIARYAKDTDDALVLVVRYEGAVP